MATQDDYIRITLRIPKDLHARLADAAEGTSKSMNAEIIARLSDSFSLGAPIDMTNQSISALPSHPEPAEVARIMDGMLSTLNTVQQQIASLRLVMRDQQDQPKE